MKAVLYNDFKFIKKLALPFVIFIGAILVLSLVVRGKFSEQFFCNGPLSWSLV